MGEVYCATDEQLGREVAVKVLPEEVGRDPERLARFRREAQLLAALNHPGIAAIYGLEEAEGRPFLVLELIEGEDLAERLQRGALPIDEALAAARQIAEALEEAHEKGIVHRDLKPANVKLRADGRVKVLDFGLAKAFAGEEAGSSPDLSTSPTLTNQSTQAGVILGTASYMSPEQARGRTVDKRADVWAFGVVLFEMLTGRRLFPGETVTDVLAAVVRDPVPLEDLPADTPARVRRLVSRCLERDPKRRLRDIGEARIALEEPLDGAPPQRESAPPPARIGRPWLPWAAAALGLGVGLVGLTRGAPRPEAPRLRAFDVTLSDDERLPRDEHPVLALASDGSTLVYVVEKGTERRLHRRSLDQVGGQEVPGTQGAANPFLSPDGRWIGFFAEGELRKVPLEGGTPTTLARAPNHRGAVWHPDGTILFVPTVTSGLSRVSDNGGEPEILTTPDAEKGERSHRWPHLLPDGERVLFTIGTLDSPGDYDAAAIGMLSLTTGERRTVFDGARAAFFAEPDVLLALRGSTLLAASFDRGGGVASRSRVVLEEVAGDASSGAGHLALARDGTLAYVPSGAVPNDLSLALVDPEGAVEPLPLEPAPYRFPRFSPDGRSLAFSIGPGRSGVEDDVWTYDIPRGVLSRLTFAGFRAAPIWSRDGRWVAYNSAEAGPGGGGEGLYRKRADGSGEEELFWPNTKASVPDAFTPEGAVIATLESPRVHLVRVLPDGGSGEAERLHPEGTEAMAATLSPDGRLMAYTSTDSGRPEVYVQSISGDGGKWQVTTQGGNSPVWSRDGGTIYYLADDASPTLMAVPVDGRNGLQVGPARRLFSGPFEVRTEPVTNYDVAPDGRFVMVLSSQRQTAVRRLNVVLGWTATRLGSRGPD